MNYITNITHKYIIKYIKLFPFHFNDQMMTLLSQCIFSLSAYFAAREKNLKNKKKLKSHNQLQFHNFVQQIDTWINNN